MYRQIIYCFRSKNVYKKTITNLSVIFSSFYKMSLNKYVSKTTEKFILIWCHFLRMWFLVLHNSIVQYKKDSN